MEQQPRPHQHDSLYSTLQSLRLLACIKYDELTMQSVSPDEVAKKLAPIVENLEKVTNEAAEKDMDGIAYAILQFDNDAGSMEAHAQYIMEKAQDLREHSNKCRRVLLQNMKSKGETSRRGLAYQAALISALQNGKATEVLVVR